MWREASRYYLTYFILLMIGSGVLVANYNEILHKNPTLETQRLLLRKFSGDDAYDLFEWGSDPEVLKTLVWNGISTIDEAHDNIFNFYLSRPGIFAIQVKESGKCIGCLDIRIDSDNEKTSFGYVLNRNFWGKGYMTEALRAVLEFCFVKLEINRVEANHYITNPASGKVMEKAGMKKEGITRQSVKVKGVLHDCVLYGILREEWKDLNSVV